MASAAVAMNPKAWMKSGNLYSLCNFALTTAHPVRLSRASFSSGPENLRMLPLSRRMSSIHFAIEGSNGQGLYNDKVCCAWARSVLAMYLRFSVTEIDENSERELGVFHAVRYLRDEAKLESYEEERIDSIIHWFSAHLEEPTRF